MKESVLRAKIAEHMELIKFSQQSLREAPERATAFLIIGAILLDEKRECENELAKLESLASASRFQAWQRSTAKQVTEKKIEADNDNTALDMAETFKECENKVKWLKGYIELFNNAHITFRQFSKDSM